MAHGASPKLLEEGLFQIYPSLLYFVTQQGFWPKALMVCRKGKEHLNAQNAARNRSSFKRQRQTAG
jgi:hypothetical protein